MILTDAATSTVIMEIVVVGKQLFDETGRILACRGVGRDEPYLWTGSAKSGLNGIGPLIPLGNQCITFYSDNNKNAKCSDFSWFSEGGVAARARLSEAICAGAGIIPVGGMGSVWR